MNQKTNVIDFESARDTLQAMRDEEAARKEEARINLNRSSRTGSMDSADDEDGYHVYKDLKAETWSVWTPFDNAQIMTFNEELDARQAARNLNRLVGEGKGFYNGKPPIGPSYA